MKTNNENIEAKNLAITIKLAELIKSGKSVSEAWETVFGAGSYVKLANHIYDAIRSSN